MVGTLVLVRPIDREGHSVGRVLIHIPRVKATCSRRYAGGSHSVWNRVIVGPGHFATLCNRYVSGDIVEALRGADALWDRDANRASSIVRA